MPAQTLNKQDMLDILLGCTVLGTGGGGELSEGIVYIDYALAQGKTFKLIDIDEAPQDAYVCTPYLLGALVDDGAANSELKGEHKWPIFTSFERLKQYTGKDFYGTICCELGGANSGISFMLSAMANGYIIDADPTGRAVPEITHSTYYLNNLPAAPAIASNAKGEVYICENIKDDLRSETVMRNLCTISDNTLSVIDHAMPINEIKHSVIKGTISKSLAIGRYLRENATKGKTALTGLAEQQNGRIIFTGLVKQSHFYDQDGFTLGTILLAGNGDYAGHNFEIKVKNENMSALLDDSLYATIPDLICCFHAETLHPVTNPNVKPTMPIVVMLLPAPEAFLTEQGLKIFGPKYAGFDTEFFSVLFANEDEGTGI